VLVHDTAPHPALADLDVKVSAGDIRDRESVRLACRGVNAVIHCAAFVRIGWSQREVYDAVNVQGTRHVAEACREAGARMVHISTTDVFGRCSLRQPTNEETPYAGGPAVPYVVTKRQAEEIVAREIAQGLDAVTVNPGFMLSPWDWKPSSGKLLLATSRGSMILAPRGWLSLCDARDVAAAILTARDQANASERYILAGRTMQWIELMRLIADTCHVRRPLLRAGPMQLKVGGWGGDLIGRVTGREPDFNSAAIAMAGLPKNYSSDRASAQLGYQIRPAAETVSDAWDWFRTHGYR
jgi:dihydroflavonol-4-reductase